MFQSVAVRYLEVISESTQIRSDYREVGYNGTNHNYIIEN